MPEPVLEARDVVKSFGRVQALRGANFTVYPNEVVALVGDNGAGKSTLVKTLVGVHPPDSGEILFDGRPVHVNTPHDARDLGPQPIPVPDRIRPTAGCASRSASSLVNRSRRRISARRAARRGGSGRGERERDRIAAADRWRARAPHRQ